MEILVGDGPNFSVCGYDASFSPAEVHESLAAPRHEDEKGPGWWYILQLKGRIGVEKIAIVILLDINR